MTRQIIGRVQGQPAVDGAGVHLVRVLGNHTVKLFDPILMLDSFDSTNPDDYTAGFPMHPHRGIETISYLNRGRMVHRDTLGNEDEIADGEVQWMTAGSGIMHEEQVPEAERLLGVQLWLNLPQDEKMSQPAYRALKGDDIEEIPFEGGKLRLLAGRYGEHRGHEGGHLPFSYYDVHLRPHAELTIPTEEDASVMAFTLLHPATIVGEDIPEKTAVKFGDGDEITLKAGEEGAEVLVMISKALHEPVAWMGPIVMNTREELYEAYTDLESGNFIRDELDFQA